MNRAEWFQVKGRLVLDHVPEAGRRLLGQGAPRLLRHPELPAACVITYICDRYSHTEDVQAIAAWLATTSLIGHQSDGASTTTEHIESSLVRPSCDAYRQRLLPFWCWWDPEIIFHSFSEYYTALSLKERSKKEVFDELITCWGHRDEELVHAIIDDAQLAYTPFSPWEVLRSTLSSAQARRIEYIIQQPICRDLLNTLSKSHPADLSEREDLTGVAEFLDAMDIVSGYATTITGESSTTLLSSIRAARKAVANRIIALSSIEQKYLLRPSSVELVIQQMLDRSRKYHVLDSMGAFSLPEGCGTTSRIPDRLHNYIFSRGGRLYHSSAGSIPSLIVTLEDSESGAPAQVSSTEFEINGTRGQFTLIADPDTKSEIHIPFTYLLDDPIDQLDLMLLAVTGWVRVDFLRITSVEQLERIAAFRLNLPETYLEHLKSLLEPILAEQYNNDAESFRQHYLTVNSTSIPDVGILSSENGKAERLYLELIEWFSAAPHVRTGLWEEYRSSRKAELDMLAGISESQAQRKPTNVEEMKESVERQRNRTEFLREQVRSYSERSTGNREQEIRRLAAQFEDEHRCLVHFAYESGHCTLFWIRGGAAQPQCGRVDASLLDVRRLRGALQRWWNATPGDVKEDALTETLAIVGEGVAQPLVDVLAPLGISHLMLSPTLFLDLVPFHCAPLGDGNRVLADAFEHVTYLPSGRVLAALKDLGPIHAETFCSVFGDYGDSLPNIAREVDGLQMVLTDLARLYPETLDVLGVLNCFRLSDVIHVASHGVWANDLHDSYVTFGENGEEVLTGARLLADGDFRNTGLAVLASCQSGTSTGSVAYTRSYAGLDAAFLARGARATISAMWEIDDFSTFLFSLRLYEALHAGASIQESFKAATDLLRWAGSGEGSMSPFLAEILTRVHPEWRSILQVRRASMAQPFVWGAYRCAGWSWLRLR